MSGHLTSARATTSANGLEVVDLLTDPDFTARPLRHRTRSSHAQALARLARAFVEDPSTLLQELTDAALELCGADSAGVSIQRRKPNGEPEYHWVATSGKYGRFLDAVLPSEPSACGLCLERNRPQIFRVGQEFFDLMGIQAELGYDGILIPWTVDSVRGTMWIISHTAPDAFDTEDCRVMQSLADFAAMSVRQQRQQRLLMAQATANSASSMAHDLAHQINNPLQSLSNLLFLAEHAADPALTRNLVDEMRPHFDRLSLLVRQLLITPKAPQSVE